MKAPTKACPKCGEQTTRLVSHDNKVHKKREKPRYNKPPIIRGKGGRFLKGGRLRA